jgi:hypothetical protein
MRRFAISALGSILAFFAGIVTASPWTSRRTVMVAPPAYARTEPCPPAQTQSATASLTIAPHRNFVFGQGRLTAVPEYVQLKSESLRYEIDVSYPQIVGSDDPSIVKVNQQLKEIATRKYQWPLNRSADVRDRDTEPGIFNTVKIDYEIGLATESFVSIYFVGYSYGIGDPQASQESLALNYDLTTGRQLKLTDIFKRGSNYLELISAYCKDDLERITGRAPSEAAVAPAAENFQNWHITSNGLTFSFDACKVFACAEGDQVVEIPFSALQHVMNPGIPGKFKITYP